MTLKEYTKKRHFNVSPEPSGKAAPSKEQETLIFVEWRAAFMGGSQRPVA